jgi:hypothetical protein
MYGIMNPNNRLNILELHRKINQKNEKKSRCYEKVLEICHKRIIAQTERDKTYCVFEFPEYVAGYPLFDLNSCIQYCEKQLIASGFLVKYYFPNKFYISWDFDEIKKQKDEDRKKIPLVAVLPKTITNANSQQPMYNSINNSLTSIQQNNSLNTSKHITLPTYNNNNNNQNTVIQNKSMNNNINNDKVDISSFNNTNQVSTPIDSIRQVESPQTVSVYKSSSTFLPNVQSQLQVKMTTPLPTSPPKYDPFDLYSPSIHDPKNNTNNSYDSNKNNNTEMKKSAIDNTFFANSFKQTLTSGIGSTKMFDYKPSGKLTLNL